MKKIITIITFISIIILSITSINIGTQGIKQYDSYKTEVYYFEDNIENAYYFENYLNDLEFKASLILEMYQNNQSSLKDLCINHLSEYNDYIDYSITINNETYTNNNNIQSLSYKYFSKTDYDHKGNRTSDSTYGDLGYYTPDITDTSLYFGLKDSFVKEVESLWYEQKTLVEDTIVHIAVCISAAIILFIVLCIIIDKKPQWIDKVYIELKLIISVILLLLAIEISLFSFNQYIIGDLSTKIFNTILISVLLPTLSIILYFLLSIVRNIKNHTIASNSIILIILRLIYRLIKKMFKDISTYITYILQHHSIIYILIILCLYTAIIGLLGIFTPSNPICLIMGIILYIIISYFIMMYLKDIKDIKEGINQISNGNTEYTIDKLIYPDLNILKDKINDISLGLNKALEKTLKAERLKTELITNVSHDIKTPLTSIISYTKLLSNIENMPEEAKDYIRIIDKKSERLKVLTQDLFDISKAQSGNIDINIEKLKIETLISQSLAEYEKELSEYSLSLNIDNNLHILADGNKMSKVLNNLLSNIIKYTLKNTRVFISAYKKDNKAIIELKNISAYPLDFNIEEITQRFTRGDSSRSEEGHGLGLAIVKSYVELCNGTFEIVIDGDMFKTYIIFDICE